MNAKNVDFCVSESIHGSTGSDGRVDGWVVRWGVPAVPCSALEYGKPGLDVLDLRGDVGLVEHEHGLGVHVGCEAGNGLVLLPDGHDLEACGNEKSFDGFSTAKG